MHVVFAPRHASVVAGAVVVSVSERRLDEVVRPAKRAELA